MKVAVIIPAAGSGNRFGGEKQFKLFRGKPLLSYSVDKFLKISLVKEIIIAVPEGQVEKIKKSFEYIFLKNKNLKVVVGGQTRQGSVKNGLNVLAEDIELVCIHDAARPLVTEKLINKTIEKSFMYDGAIAAIQPVDTVKLIFNDKIKQSLDRKNIWLAQTPQVFKKDKLISAFENALNKKIIGTDESSLMEEAGFFVVPVDGDISNFKVTSPEDWERLNKAGK